MNDSRWRRPHCSFGNCVEIRYARNGNILVRDSNNPDGPTLTFTPAEWAAFVAGVKAGEFDVEEAE